MVWVKPVQPGHSCWNGDRQACRIRMSLVHDVTVCPLPEHQPQGIKALLSPTPDCPATALSSLALKHP